MGANYDFYRWILGDRASSYLSEVGAGDVAPIFSLLRRSGPHA